MRTKPINSPARGRRLNRLVGARSPEYKEAWMAGARAGNDVAFELVLRAIENLMKTLGIKRRKRPDAAVSDPRSKDYEKH